MNEDRFEHLLKTSLEENSETELSKGFTEGIKSKIEGRNRIRTWRSWILQGTLIFLAFFIGVILLLIFGNTLHLPETWIPYIPGFVILIILFQILDKRIKKGEFLNS